MQETQCDKFGVSGGLGEPRFGLKLWLGSADLIDDNSSKSWVLFRDLPYLAIVMGVDLVCSEPGSQGYSVGSSSGPFVTPKQPAMCTISALLVSLSPSLPNVDVDEELGC